MQTEADFRLVCAELRTRQQIVGPVAGKHHIVLDSIIQAIRICEFPSRDRQARFHVRAVDDRGAVRFISVNRGDVDDAFLTARHPGRRALYACMIKIRDLRITVSGTVRPRVLIQFVLILINTERIDAEIHGFVCSCNVRIVNIKVDDQLRIFQITGNRDQVCAVDSVCKGLVDLIEIALVDQISCCIILILFTEQLCKRAVSRCACSDRRQTGCCCAGRCNDNAFAEHSDFTAGHRGAACCCIILCHF